jgi:heterodisulfide reductase subunit C
MDYLRQKSLEQKMVNPKARDIVAFHQSFLKSLKYTGRLYELGLIMDYKLHTGNLMQDVKIAPAMMAAGKLGIIPELLEDKKAMPFIFARTINKKK